MYIVAIENEEWFWCASFVNRVEAIRYWRESCIKYPDKYDRFVVLCILPDNDIVVVKDRAVDAYN